MHYSLATGVYILYEKSDQSIGTQERRLVEKRQVCSFSILGQQREGTHFYVHSQTKIDDKKTKKK